MGQLRRAGILCAWNIEAFSDRGLRPVTCTTPQLATHPEVIVWFHQAAASGGLHSSLVARFLYYVDTCTPGEEAAWRREPVFVTSAEEKERS